MYRRAPRRPSAGGYTRIERHEGARWEVPLEAAARPLDLAHELVDLLTDRVKSHGLRLNSEGDPESGWLLVDAGQGVFVHLFSMETRAYYDLEGLWSRAQEVVRIQ